MGASQRTIASRMCHDGGLCGAARAVVGGDGVLAVFDDVEVEAAHFDRAEVEELLVNQVKFVVFVGGDDGFCRASARAMA